MEHEWVTERRHFWMKCLAEAPIHTGRFKADVDMTANFPSHFPQYPGPASSNFQWDQVMKPFARPELSAFPIGTSALRSCSLTRPTNTTSPKPAARARSPYQILTPILKRAIRRQVSSSQHLPRRPSMSQTKFLHLSHPVSDTAETASSPLIDIPSVTTADTIQTPSSAVDSVASETADTATISAHRSAPPTPSPRSSPVYNLYNASPVRHRSASLNFSLAPMEDLPPPAQVPEDLPPPTHVPATLHTPTFDENVTRINGSDFGANVDTPHTGDEYVPPAADPRSLDARAFDNWVAQWSKELTRSSDYPQDLIDERKTRSVVRFLQNPIFWERIAPELIKADRQALEHSCPSVGEALMNETWCVVVGYESGKTTVTRRLYYSGKDVTDLRIRAFNAACDHNIRGLATINGYQMETRQQMTEALYACSHGSSENVRRPGRSGLDWQLLSQLKNHFPYLQSVAMLCSPLSRTKSGRQRRRKCRIRQHRR
ncbi:unnamed protein product [Zymoseptoria tritici ST99CH_1A5]|uniref:Uncharacterized protein n=1 Tax=Zymoseptoria tritici ST99CH_1A5 TaxID=1276529 RepID=A0A1Y6LZI1_ZYMTR|nr:unnamed protein product [Zymoseptoria tritici ST99CH_3D1]SMY28860.1 unnamed protein product [Zymoseptoria tritici ST99CH_1A5]